MDRYRVLQSYSAFTTSLDRLDAEFLLSRRAPQRILVHFTSDIDGRLLPFDQGQTSRAMLCRYRVLRAAPPIAVLGAAQSCCSAPSLIATVHAGWDQTVAVQPPPNAHSLVFVRIGGIGVGGLERLQALLWKPGLRYVILNGCGRARLVSGTAADGLPQQLAPGLDYPRPFNIASRAKTIAVAKDGQEPTRGGEITYSFYAQSLDGST